MCMFFRQIRGDGNNFSYVFADEVTREAAVVDSSFNLAEIERVVEGEGLKLLYVFSTHGHSDHTAGNGELRRLFGAKVVAHQLFRGAVDVVVGDGDVVMVGGVQVRVIHTPGHTPDGICLLVDGGKLLTGDTLFVGECGRTDLPGGNSRSLYDSLFNKLLKLEDGVEVYPGHDYGSKPFSTIGEERRTNYTLEPRSVEEFVAFMLEP